jgi:mono/diheme cytochrome c family protein
MKSPSFRMYHKGQVVQVTWHEDSPTPQETVGRRRARWFWGFVLVALLVVGTIVYWAIFADVPVDYTSIRDHFKYGSIGAEAGNGVPYHLWKALPAMFPEYLPDGGKGGYASLGFLYESGPGVPDTPIGFSKRRHTGVTLVGLNCAVCHSSTVRASATADPEIYLGMPAHKLDLLGYFAFLFKCAQDERFTTDNIMKTIGPQLWPHEKIVYRFAIPLTKQRLIQRYKQAKFMLDHPSGPGRIDTFTPYKAIQFGFPVPDDTPVGNADFPSLWNQKPREGMNLHWDGNNDSVAERNISAAIGAGATPVSLDRPRMQRVMNWIWTLPPPRYPWAIDEGLARRGAPLYRARCAGCHDIGAEKFRTADGHAYGVGEVVPYPLIRTDRDRLDSYTVELSMNQYTLGSGLEWRFTHFRKTGGYANAPLDGIWLRAPYLHNGSVPTLRDLLERPSARPEVFSRGDDVYDPVKVGFVSNLSERKGRRFARYDAGHGTDGTAHVRGNGNGGHEYGVDLTAVEKDSLVEYMKTL